VIRSLIKAIDILESFSIEKPETTLSELAAATGHPKTTLRTLLATLESRGYITRAGTRYALGSASIGLSQSAWVNVEIRDRAAPDLRRMADEVGESVYLTVPEGFRILYIYAIESSHRLEARSAIGDHAYYHSTSVGKALLAHMPPEEREQILDHTGLPQRTQNTITDRAAFERELEITRERRYAIDNMEGVPDTYCLGAPIFAAGGGIVASCSISGNSPDVVTDRCADLVPILLATADAISKRLGYIPTRLRAAPV
jgi:DNA-binding IclR family transcriptional regulator